MPILRTYTVRTSLAHLLTVMDALGAHVASKLQLFGTDERTLTDELCDMFCIWAQTEQPVTKAKYNSNILRHPIQLTITKTTQQEEADFGHDLAIRITSPQGVKHALLQAKVFDPQDQILRCDSTAGWRKLASQLILMRSYLRSWKNDLAFLLIYLPSSLLTQVAQPMNTWEVEAARPFTSGPGKQRNPAFGTTLIAFDDLLDNDNAWKFHPPISHVGNGAFRPDGITLSQLLIDMLLCQRGRWFPRSVFPDQTSELNPEFLHGFPISFVPYRQIGISIEDMSLEGWRVYKNDLKEGCRDIDFNSESHTATHPVIDAAVAGNRRGIVSSTSSSEYIESRLGIDPVSQVLTDTISQEWADVQRVDDQAIGKGQHIPLLAREVWCALATASIHGICMTLPSVFLLELKESGLLIDDQAIALARQNPRARKRMEALLALAPSLDGEKRLQVLYEALEAVTAHREDDDEFPNQLDQARLLAELLPHLPDSMFEKILSAVGKVSNEVTRASALSEVASRVPEYLIDRALSMVAELEFEWPRAKSLTALVSSMPSLSKSRLTIVSAILDSLKDEVARAVAIAALARLLPKGVLSRAIDEFTSITDSNIRLECLSTFGEWLNETSRLDILRQANAIEDPALVGRILQNLAKTLKGRSQEIALNIAIKIKWDTTSAETVGYLVPYFTDPLLETTLRLLDRMPQQSRGIALERMSKDLPDSLMEYALRVLPYSAVNHHQARVIENLAPRLPKSLIGRALNAVLAIQNDWVRTKALTHLLPHLPSNYLSEILQNARQCSNEKTRARQLQILLPYLSEAQIREAWNIASSIVSNDSRAAICAELAPRVALDERPQAIDSALAVAATLERTEYKVEVLSKITPYLSPAQRRELLLETFRALSIIRGKAAQDEALLVLAPHAPAIVLSDGWESIGTALEPQDRTRKLCKLVPHMPPASQVHGWREVLKAAQSIESIRSRVSALAHVLPCVPTELRDTAQATAWELQDKIGKPEDRVAALVSLIPNLTPNVQSIAITTAWKLTDHVEHKMYRITAKASVLEVMSASQREGAVAEAFAAAQLVPAARRGWALQQIAEYLPYDLLERALDQVRLIGDHADRAWALPTLALRTTGTRRTRWLRVALDEALPAHFRQTPSPLKELVPHLPESLLHRALLWRNIENSAQRARLFQVLAPGLPESLLPETITICRAMEEDSAQGEAMAALLSRQAQLGHAEDALMDARKIRHKAMQVRALTGVVPHLPPAARQSTLSEVLDALRALPAQSLLHCWRDGWSSILNEQWRQNAMNELIPFLPEESLVAALRILCIPPGPAPASLSKLTVRVVDVGSESTCLAFWREVSNLMATRPRSILLTRLESILPVMSKLGPPDLASDVATAIKNVTYRWP